MLKPEFIKELKQTNVSKNAGKTKERLRSIWKSLDMPKREEILSSAGLVKSSIARSYKTGNISAKITAAVAQVAEIDPLYLTGVSDEQRPYADELVVNFLTGLNYEIGKRDIVKKRKTNSGSSALPENDTAAAAQEDKKSQSSDAVFEGQPTLSGMAESLFALLDGDAKDKLDSLTEDDIILMIKSLKIQATFSSNNKTKFELIKCLLLT